MQTGALSSLLWLAGSSPGNDGKVSVEGIFNCQKAYIVRWNNLRGCLITMLRVVRSSSLDFDRTILQARSLLETAPEDCINPFCDDYRPIYTSFPLVVRIVTDECNT